MRKIVLITGTPGVGKTSTAKKLSSNIGAININIDELAKKESLFLGRDEKRETYIADVKKITKKIKKILDNCSTDIIFDGHYSPNIIKSSPETFVFVLRRDPNILKKELSKRGFKKRKILENISSEILDVCLIEALKKHKDMVHEINTTNRSIEEVVEEIILVLNGKIERKVGKISWVEKFEQELQKIFNY